MNEPRLNHRTRKILAAVVREYLNRGAAVGSKTIAESNEINLSPASIRTVMGQLETLGYLEQPHASSGRVPTSSGLRFFVDSIVQVRPLSSSERSEISSRIQDRNKQEGVLESTSQVLSELTNYAGVVMVPATRQQRIRHIEFVGLSPVRLVCVLMTDDGRIHNKLIEISAPMANAELEKINNFLSRFQGDTLEEIHLKVARELEVERSEYETKKKALELSENLLAQTSPSGEVIMAGATRLLESPSDQSLEEITTLLRALETKEVVMSLLDQSIQAEELQVFLGSETSIEGFGKTSVITKPYGDGDQTIGAIAVIGPQRMNYSRVMSLVNFAATLITDSLTENS